MRRGWSEGGCSYPGRPAGPFSASASSGATGGSESGSSRRRNVVSKLGYANSPPAAARSPCPCGSSCSTGFLPDGRRTSRWPRRPRSSTSSTSGPGAGCARSAPKEWKRFAARRRNLRALGIPDWQARQWATSRKGCWRLSGSAPLQRALPNRYWVDLGLVSISDRVRRLREHWRTAGCGPARPVVWEGAV